MDHNETMRASFFIKFMSKMDHFRLKRVNFRSKLKGVVVIFQTLFDFEE